MCKDSAEMPQSGIIFRNWQKGTTALCAWLRRNQHRSIRLSKKVILYQTGFIVHHRCTLDNGAVFSTANQKTALRPWGDAGRRRRRLQVWAFKLQQCLCSFQSIMAFSPVNEFTKPPQEDPERPASSLWRRGGGGRGEGGRRGLRNWKGKKRK